MKAQSKSDLSRSKFALLNVILTASLFLVVSASHKSVTFQAAPANAVKYFFKYVQQSTWSMIPTAGCVTALSSFG